MIDIYIILPVVLYVRICLIMNNELNIYKFVDNYINMCIAMYVYNYIDCYVPCMSLFFPLLLFIYHNNNVTMMTQITIPTTQATTTPITIVEESWPPVCTSLDGIIIAVLPVGIIAAIILVDIIVSVVSDEVDMLLLVCVLIDELTVYMAVLMVDISLVTVGITDTVVNEI